MNLFLLYKQILKYLTHVYAQIIKVQDSQKMYSQTLSDVNIKILEHFFKRPKYTTHKNMKLMVIRNLFKMIKLIAKSILLVV